jgi:hypothetical protein
MNLNELFEAAKIQFPSQNVGLRGEDAQGLINSVSIASKGAQDGIWSTVYIRPDGQKVVFSSQDSKGSSGRWALEDGKIKI